MMTICDLCEEHGFRLQQRFRGRLYCILMDDFGPMNGKYRIRDYAECEDVYDEPPPYCCIAEEYVPAVTPIL